MVQTVVRTSEVSLDTQRYKLDGDMHVTLLEGFAEKLVLGDFTPQNYRRRSVVRWSDFSRGLGQQIVSPQDNDVNLRRSWWSTSHTRNRGHIILPPLATDMTGEVGTVPSTSVRFGGSGDGEQLFVAMSGNVLRTNASNNAFTDTAHNLTNANVSAVAGRFNGTDYIVWGQDGSGYEFATDGASYTTGGREGHFLVQWDSRLWGFDIDDHQLWFTIEPSATAGDHKDDAILPVDIGTALGMFVGPDALGEEIIYVLTRDALWAHDAANRRFIKTNFQIFNPIVKNNSQAVRDYVIKPIVWRGVIYIPVAMNVWEYNPVAGTIRAIGPDFESADDASGLSVSLVLPGSDQRGAIRTLTSSANEIFAVVDPQPLGLPGSTTILSWNSRGWSVTWQGTIGATFFSNVASVGVQAKTATSEYRIWFHENDSFKYIDLPTDVTNPKQNTAYKYASSSVHLLPWLDVGTDSKPVALRVKVEAIDLSSNETVTLSYRTDLSNHTDISTGFTTLGSAMTADGTTEFVFPDTTTSEGLSFRSHIQFRLALARGGTNTNSPDVLSLEFEYYKKPTRRFAFDFVLDTRKGSGTKSPGDQFWALMESLKTKNTLLELTYRNTDATFTASNGDVLTFTYYVEVTHVEIIEQSTGFTDGALIRIRAEEV